MERLRRVVPVDAVFFATCDPATLLFTDVVADDVLVPLTPLFLQNEFSRSDVNQFRNLASSADAAVTLDQATGGRRLDSPRYRTILEPAGLGDEMRVALRSGDMCWGFMCLHRERGSGFSDAEVVFMSSVARPIAEGLRAAIVTASLTKAESRQPGVLLISASLELEAATPAGHALLEELTGPGEPGELPLSVQAVAARLIARDLGQDGPPPTVRALSRANRWLVIHATHLADTNGADRIAVIIEAASAEEFIPLMLRAHRLGAREAAVAALVLSGQSTKEISKELDLTENSVQDHLKAVFEKVGVHSRRELTAHLQGRR
jgi:DNA-binding NarL/FixJ family response regulator